MMVDVLIWLGLFREIQGTAPQLAPGSVLSVAYWKGSALQQGTNSGSLLQALSHHQLSIS
jgi:hypothetical protein